MRAILEAGGGRGGGKSPWEMTSRKAAPLDSLSTADPIYCNGKEFCLRASTFLSVSTKLPQMSYSIFKGVCFKASIDSVYFHLYFNIIF